ncbi:hypothetical protein [Williamsia sp.]|uniref:hypothetical protein n=1 Tax=Williamsia sp. TaxID=1872085 RepID=UPI001A2E2A7A|nr:hypothetical protein [Williamsia sp.]MBJ7291880.1 hypothetical protein [Williamsia sp.]
MTATYAGLVRNRGFRNLFVVQAGIMASSSTSSLALGVVMFAQTSSPLLTALAMFGGPLIAFGASYFLLSWSDRVPPRIGLALTATALLVTDLLQAIPDLPWPVRFVLLAIPWITNSATSGSKWLILQSVVGADDYLFGRSTLNIAVSVTQIAGYGAGGTLLHVCSPQSIFLVAAGVDAVIVCLTLIGLPHVPPTSTTGSGHGERMVTQTRRTNRVLLRSVVTRPIYLSLWIPNGLIVGCEALFVPFAGNSSGYLYMAGAAGMLSGDVIVGRFVAARRRDSLIWPLRTLIAAPYLVFLLSPSFTPAIMVVFVASIGYAASLPLQDRLIRNTDPAARGQTLGLHTTGMLIFQGVGAALAGGVASVLEPSIAIGLMGCASLIVTLSLTRGLRRSRMPVEAAAVPAR